MNLDELLTELERICFVNFHVRVWRIVKPMFEQVRAQTEARVTREELIECVAHAWAKTHSIQRTLEETFEYQRVQAGRFICSGEAADIADAVLKLFTTPPSTTMGTADA